METHNKRSLYLLFLVTIVAVVGYGALLFLQKHNKYTPSGMMTTSESEVQVSEEEGYLLLTASQSGETSLASYTYDLVNETLRRTHPTVPIIHAVPVTGDIVTGGIRNVDETDETSADYIQGGYVDFVNEQYGFFDLPAVYNESDLVMSDRGTAAAYSATAEPVMNENDWALLDNWQVVLYVPEDEYTNVIENAAHPQWVVGDTVIAYIKADGLYFYDREADTETRVIDVYDNLSYLDDFGLSMVSEGDTLEGLLAMTIPSLGVIETYYIDEALNIFLLSESFSEEMYYTDPVVNPTATAVAALRHNNSQTNVIIFDTALNELDSFAVSGINNDDMFLDAWVETIASGN